MLRVDSDAAPPHDSPVRPPDDVASEHARCPHQAQISVTSIAPHGERATVEGKVVRVIRGALKPGDVIRFELPIAADDQDSFGETLLPWAWAERQKYFEVCLTESFTLPSADSIEGIDGPDDQVHLHLPQACTVCPDGFMEPEAAPSHFLDSRPELGFVLAIGGLAAVGFLAGTSAIDASVLWLMPVAVSLIPLGIGLHLFIMRTRPHVLRCIRCGALAPHTHLRGHH